MRVLMEIPWLLHLRALLIPIVWVQLGRHFRELVVCILGTSEFAVSQVVTWSEVQAGVCQLVALLRREEQWRFEVVSSPLAAPGRLRHDSDHVSGAIVVVGFRLQLELAELRRIYCLRDQGLVLDFVDVES